MQLHIIENLKKKDGYLTISLHERQSRKIIEDWSCKGTTAYSEFIDATSQNSKLMLAESLEIACFTIQPSYLNHFKVIKEIFMISS